MWPGVPFHEAAWKTSQEKVGSSHSRIMPRAGAGLALLCVNGCTVSSRSLSANLDHVDRMDEVQKIPRTLDLKKSDVLVKNMTREWQLIPVV